MYEELIGLMPAGWHRKLAEAHTQLHGWWGQGKYFILAGKGGESEYVPLAQEPGQL